jgi:hypothetical protein
VRGSNGLLLERLHDDALDVCVRDRARLSRPRLVVQAVEAALGEAASPPPHRGRVAAQLQGDLLARRRFGCRQHDAAAKGERLRGLRPPHPPLEHLTPLGVEHDLCTLRHGRPPIIAIDDDDIGADRLVPAN